MNILILEDDQMIAYGLIYALEQEGYQVTHFETIKQARNYIENQPSTFHLALLDMQLPDGEGTQIAEMLSIPIIFLTIIDDEERIVHAFENGAADYVTKPFRIKELLARIKRAIGSSKNDGQLMIGNLKIDTNAAKVYAGEELIELTALEYRLLLIFAMNKGQILTRQQILESIWDAAGEFVEDNTLSVYMKRLRKKLGNWVDIQTVRGMGYRLE
ncbi:MAG: response regulator transcription factor [Streptococcaceae bacterium]|jgi:DNA-binding response OmpR family regulator|nr:response regulator transcription factor [Streptococcaceae bacterium]